MIVLLVDDDKSFRQLVRLHLENTFEDLSIIEKECGTDAIEYLKNQARPDLVICDFDMEPGNGLTVYTHLFQKGKLLVPFLLMSSVDAADPRLKSYTRKNPLLAKPFDRSQLINSLKQVFSGPNWEEISFEKEFYKVRAILFHRYNKTSCDIYLRLSPVKFVKLFHKDTSFTVAELEQYRQRYNQYFYIKKTDYKDFALSMLDQKFLSFDGPAEEKIARGQAMLQELLKTVGLSTQTLKNLNELHQETEKEIQRDPEISRLLGDARQKNNYIYDHSYLLSFICLTILQKMPWQSPQIRKRMILASLLHDLMLDDPKLAYVMDNEELTLANLSRKEDQVVLNHTVEMTNLLSRKEGKALGIDEIILNHHENPWGSGFPRKLDPQKLSLPTKLFIFSHHFISALYRASFDESKIATVIDEMKKDFSVGDFALFATALEETVIKSKKAA